MKKMLVGFIGFIVVIVVIAILTPFLINVNNFKPQIMAMAKEALGRDLKIEGHLQLRLLPQVKITAENVQLANVATGSQPTMISVEKMHLKLSLWPLFKKKLHIQKIEIIKPTVFLERLANGQSNWEFKPLDSSAIDQDRLKNVSLSLDSTNTPASKNFDINVQSLKIVDGRLQYKDGKILQEVNHITCEVRLDSRQGPLHAQGDLKYADQLLNFNVDLGKIDETQSLLAKFNSESSNFEIDGKLQKNNFIGRVKTEINFLQFEKILGTKGFRPATLGAKAVISSDVSMSEKSVKCEHLQIKAGQLDALGSFEIDHEAEIKVQGRLENLPGNSQIVVTSHQTSQEKGGNIEIHVDRMKQVLEFLQQDISAIPKALLEKSNFKANYKITPTAIHLQNLYLDLRLTTLIGEVSWGINSPKILMTMDLKTVNIVPLLILMGMPANPNQIMPSALKGKVEGDPQSFIFETLAEMGRTSLRAEGNGSDLGGQLDVSSDIHLKSISLVNLLQQFGITIPNIFNQMTLDGKMAHKGQEIQLNTSIQAGELIFQAKGSVLKNAQGPQFNLDISTTHPNLKKLLGHLGTSTTAPTGNFSLDGHLEGSLATVLNINSIKGKLGSAGSFKGAIGYRAAGQNSKPHINANLSFREIDLENLFAFTNYAITMPPSLYPQYILAAAISHKRSPWSREILDLHFLDYFDADFKIDATQISKGDLLFKNVSLNAAINQGILNIMDVKADFYGGHFELKGQTDSHKNNVSQYQFSLKGAALKNLSPKQGAIKITQGNMDVIGDLQTFGNSINNLVEGLNGKVTLHAQDGMISGFDLQAVTSNLMKQNRLEGVSNLLRTSLKQGQTAFSVLEGEIDFKQGIGYLKDVKLVAQGGEGSAEGTVDLPAYEMNVSAQFALIDLKNVPPFGVQFIGPLDAPVRKIDSSGLEKFMAQNVMNIVNDAMRTGKIKPKDLLNSLLGKGQSDPTSDTSDTTNSQQPAPSQDFQSQAPAAEKPPIEDMVRNPEKAVKGLLKGLF